MNEPTLRALLYALALSQLAFGALMVISPETFFEEIGEYGVRNDHYIRDAASFYLAAAAGLFIAAARPAWRVPILVVGAFWYGFHGLNHLTDIGEASTDARGAFDTISLLLGAVGAAWLASVSARLQREGRTRA